MKKLLSIFLLIIIAIAANSCQKEPNAPGGGNIIEIGETNVAHVSYSTAIVNSVIASIGGNQITQHGFCWSTEKEPTTKDNKTTLGELEKKGIFDSEITDLENNTSYYIRSYITYQYGTIYGQVVSFKTLMGFTDPRDGQTYKTIVIGSQTWMAENLNYQTSNSWWYDNSSANGDIYGRLYTWEAALTACPFGWHLPSDDEWKSLEMHLGMSQSEADNSGYRGTDEGKKLKSTSGWSNNGNGTNSSGFNALAGGYRYSNGSFSSLGHYGHWWSSSEGSGSYAWSRSLYSSSGLVRRNHGSKTDGFSVRCLKN